MEAASTQRKNLVRSLDPRMKLLLVVVISTATMFTPSREVVAWNYIIIILLWLVLCQDLAQVKMRNLSSS